MFYVLCYKHCIKCQEQYLHQNNLDPHQSGFKVGHSTEPPGSDGVVPCRWSELSLLCPVPPGPVFSIQYSEPSDPPLHP